MTETGLKRNDSGENIEKKRPEKGNGYRYKNKKDSFPEKEDKEGMIPENRKEPVKQVKEIQEDPQAEPISMAKPKLETEVEPLLF